MKIVQILRRWLQRATYVGLALSLGYSLPAAAVNGPSPAVSIGVYDGFGQGPFQYFDTSISQIVSQPFFPEASMTWTLGEFNKAFAGGADIYFGWIFPGGTTVYTWSPGSNGTIALNRGYSPLLRGLSVLNGGSFDTASLNTTSSKIDSPFRYSFTGSEVKGLYLLLFFTVPSGTDPTNITQWSNVTLQPAFVK